ncbi:MAG: hypothetical protein HYU56_00640 [Candidatus Aenigmarchaeota archaeon]|nr:hypothetical protein [Candidatus Aenigmarchaeota archaeon]
MKKFAPLLLSLLAMVFVSACVGGTTTIDPNNGLKINEFSADRAIVEQTDLVSFFADIQNVGGTTASCVRAQLLNVDSWRTTTGDTLSLQGISDFNAIGFSSSGSFFGNLCIGKNFCVSVAKGAGGLSLSGFIGNIFSDLSKEAICNKNLFKNDAKLQQVFKFQEELAPPDKERNRPGQSFTADWTLVPPVLPEGLRTEFHPAVRVTYVYKTTASITIPVMTKNEYESRINLGKPVDATFKVEHPLGGAPIKVAVTRATSPIIVNTDPVAISQNPIERATYIIELQNVGNGIPTPAEFTGAPGQTGKQGGFVLGAVTLSGSGVQFDDCLGNGVSAALNRGQIASPVFVTPSVFTTGNQQLLLGGNSEILRLRSDKKAPFGCTLAIDRQAWTSRPFGEILMTFDLYYLYNVDKETTITVKGVEGNTPTF